MRIGDLLVGAGLVSVDELAAALQKQSLDKKTPLGQLLKLLNHLNEEELDLVLQAQRRILYASMPGELAIEAIKYAKENGLNFARATEKVLVMSRGSLPFAGQSGRYENSLSRAAQVGESKTSAGVRVFCDPCDLIQQSDEAAARKEWDQAISLLVQACAVYESGSAESCQSAIPIYCRLIGAYIKTDCIEKARSSIVKVTQMVAREQKIVPGSLALLAATARSSSRQGMTGEAADLYLLVMPKWTELLPFEFAQFNVCLRDAVACSRAIKAPERQNIRMGELLINSGLVSARQFQEALQKSRSAHKPLGRIMSETGLICTQDLRNAVRVQIMCRATVLPGEYAASIVRAASLTSLSPAEFFEKLNLPPESETAKDGSLAELVTKMDRLLLMEEMHGVTHPEVAVLADEVGDICLRRAEFDDAEAMFRRAHAVFAVAGERYQLNLAGVCQKLAQLLIQQKKYPETELLLLQAKEIKGRLLGDQNQELAGVLVDLGYYYFCQANYGTAIDLLHSAWAIQKKTAGREQKRYLLELLIKCYEQSGQEAESDGYRQNLRDIRQAE